MAKKGKGGGKLTRTYSVVVRIDPRLKYIAELCARLHRRTLSSFIEWSVQTAVQQVKTGIYLQDETSPATLWDMRDLLWKSDEVDRFLALVEYLPDLLTFEERMLWEHISDSLLFLELPPEELRLPSINYTGNVKYINRKALRESWDELSEKFGLK
jgi:hypothetical protein